jgi:hypothetical protein
VAHVEYSQPLADLHRDNVSNPDLFPVPPRGVPLWAEGTRVVMPDGSKARVVLLPRMLPFAENAFG